jgi:hypothetical protein
LLHICLSVVKVSEVSGVLSGRPAFCAQWPPAARAVLFGATLSC